MKGLGVARFERFRSDGRNGARDAKVEEEGAEREALRLIDDGNACEDEGRMAEALERYDAAIRLAPNLARAHLNRGNALLAMGDGDGAVNAFAEALVLKPDYAAAHYNLGNAHVRSGRPKAALDGYRKAIALKPDFADAEVAQGGVQEGLGQYQAAIASYRRALTINPAYAGAHCNLGNALKELGRFDDAVASYRRALEIAPDFVEAHCNLGIALTELGRHEDAVASYRRALAIRPDSSAAHDNLLFGLCHMDALSAPELFAEHCRFGAQFEAPLRAGWPVHVNSRDPERCLQVGFVSGDLHDHAVAYFIEPLLTRLADRQSLALHAYYTRAIEDAVTKRMRGHFRYWHAVAHLSDAALAHKVVADGIDILIDLSGHTGGNRLLCFARKPAPIQASWIGYPGTTGLAAMDYYLADRYFLPANKFASQFTEKLVYLPAVAAFLPDERAPPVNALPALSNGYVTFGSFNRLSKLTPSGIALWSRLLRAIPDARMLLGAMPEDGRYNPLVEWFAKEGIARERLSFHPRCSTAAYLALHHQVDICLDTFPYTGGTTTNHALWMGVPTLSLAGHTPPGRQGAAILGHVGLEAFVAADAGDFEEKGLRWARDLDALAHVRAELRRRYEGSSLRHPAVIAIGLDRALRTMWQRWCAGLPTEAVDVSAPTNDERPGRGLV